MKEKKREPTPDEKIGIMEEVRRIKIIQEVKDLRTDNKRLTTLFGQDHKERPDHAWNQIMYEDMPKIEELDIILSASIPEVLPLSPSPKPRDVITQQVTNELIEVLDEEK